jgi:hypothetical protein
MKTIMYFFVMALIVMAGCAKDDTMPQTQDNLELKKAKVPIPFKAELYASPDMDSEPLTVILPWGGNISIPSRMIVKGTATHFGRVNSEKSYYEFKTYELYFDEDGRLFSYNTGIGVMVGANGDSMEFTWWVRQNRKTGDYYGENEVVPGSGTGKFKGATGSSTTVGWYHEDGVGVAFKIDGFLNFE